MLTEVKIGNFSVGVSKYVPFKSPFRHLLAIQKHLDVSSRSSLDFVMDESPCRSFLVLGKVAVREEPFVLSVARAVKSADDTVYVYPGTSTNVFLSPLFLISVEISLSVQPSSP